MSQEQTLKSSMSLRKRNNKTLEPVMNYECIAGSNRVSPVPYSLFPIPYLM
jgi:hypothetical protein